MHLLGLFCTGGDQLGRRWKNSWLLLIMDSSQPTTHDPRPTTSEFKIEGTSISFWLRVKPRAQRDRLKIGASGELTLEVHAPPFEGQANEACVRFLASALKVPRADVELAAGGRSRRKLIRITGRPGEETMSKIRALAGMGVARRPA